MISCLSSQGTIPVNAIYGDLIGRLHFSYQKAILSKTQLDQEPN